MKFSEFDQRMRIYETAHDHCVMPGMYIVARLDGRSFTRLTRETLELEAPFDPMFMDAMLRTTEDLMQCGIQAIYGYTQSDEISILLSRKEQSFGRKERKLLSILAGEASASLTTRLCTRAVVDCRISQLPTYSLVVDYFRWRQADAARNALNSACYWALRGSGMTAKNATKKMLGLSVSQKHDLLHSRGKNFNDLPNRCKRGSGVFWTMEPKEGVNPMTGKTVWVDRRTLTVDHELPMGDEYGRMILQFLAVGDADEDADRAPAALAQPQM